MEIVHDGMESLIARDQIVHDGMEIVHDGMESLIARNQIVHDEMESLIARDQVVHDAMERNDEVFRERPWVARRRSRTRASANRRLSLVRCRGRPEA